MTITVSPTETQQWIKTTDRRTGRQLAVAIPSQSEPGKWHLVSRYGCDCRGFQYRGTCRHHVALLIQIQQRTRPLNDGGTADLATRRASGNWPAVSAETAANAAEYASIFGRDE